MDFLDPKKERQNRITLLLGYCLVALAIGIATLVLLYQSFGYNLNDEGEVTQNGLVFVSSQPTNAKIYLNNKQYKSNTNTRVTIPAGDYQLRIAEDGYRTWQRPIRVNGGDVQHFDYPFLVPQTLTTKSLSELVSAPSLATQSPDKRWLIMNEAAKTGGFIEYDFKDPKKPVMTTIALPDGSYTPGTNEEWSIVEWATDNKHVLLLHTYTSGSATQHEYVLMDRDSPVDSVDLTTSLKLTPTQELTLFNNRIDQFYVFDATAKTLERINASDGSVVNELDNILAFKSYGSDYLLYVTSKSPTGNQVANQATVVLQAGQKAVTLRTLPASDVTKYALNLAQYSNDWYVAVAASTDNAAYIYKNPQDQPITNVDKLPSPWRRLPIDNPTFLSFSSNTQFLMAESGQKFVVYDFENIEQYRFTATEPIDKPQQHAAWMDGNRIIYVSNGKIVMYDYDYRNKQTLQTADAKYTPFFAPNFSYSYVLKPATDTTKTTLTSTPLVIEKQ